MTADLVLLHARQLLTCAGPAPRRGAAQAESTAIPDGAVAVLERPHRLRRADAETLAPTLRWHRRASSTSSPAQHRSRLRRRAYACRLRRRSPRRAAPPAGGETYAEIAAAGGGIVSTVAATRRSIGSGARRGDAYAARRDAGLRHDDVRDQERLWADHRGRAEDAARDRATPAARTPMTIVPTFMGAHEVPIEYRERRDDYVDLVVDEMIPAVAAADSPSGAMSSARTASSRRPKPRASSTPGQPPG